MAALVPDRLRQPSPNPQIRNTQGLSINLSSNNPFRNRAASPASNSPRTLDAPTDNRRDNRMSRNPFLDVSELNTAPPPQRGDSNGFNADIFMSTSQESQEQSSLPQGAMAMDRFERCRDMFADLMNLQKDLSLLDKPANGGAAPPRPPPQAPLRAPPRAGTAPMSGLSGPRPGESDNRRDKSRGPPPPRGPESPDKRMQPRRPRGLSESSVIDKDRETRRERDRSERPPRTESEERRRRERRREREERHKREKEKIRGGGRSGTKKNQGLDIIDKLDVTGIYGQGLFHHDGPFDACNPHRNTKKDRRAPMQAFPAGSANMALGGNGPLNSRLNLDRFHGREEEAFDTFAATRKADTAIVDPMRAEEVHGDASNGLGTSTFLEGAPASRRDLQRRDSEDPPQQQFQPSNGSGLARKKSLAQRLRGMSAARRGPGGEIRSPDARYYPNGGDNSPPNNKAISAGGPARARYNKENEINPFDNDYEDAYEKKGAQIRVAEQGESRPFGTGRNRAPSGAQLQRSVTADSAMGGGESAPQPSGSGGGGFLSRMKSLKGGRRPRPERRAS